MHPLGADDDYAVQKKKDNVGTAPQPHGSANSSVVVTEQDGLSALPYILSQLRLVAVYGALLAGSMAALQHSTALRLPPWAVQALYGTGAHPQRELHSRLRRLAQPAAGKHHQLSVVLKALLLLALLLLPAAAFLAFVPMPLMGYGTLSALLARRPAVPATVSPWAPRSVSDFWG